MANPILDPNAPAFTRRYMNLADPRLGAKALHASDEFFAPKERMLDPQPAVFIPGKYDDHGKWMDGWETRRKRTTGHDYCVIRLARAGVVHGVDLDTSHFTGNFPPAASIDACHVDSDVPPDNADWQTLVPPTTLQGNQHHYVEMNDARAFTHLRVNLYPDGGLARLRVYGQPKRDWARVERGTLLDLAAIENGAYLVAANNQHFGPASQMLMPGRGVNMGDGWETRRRREPGNDWAIVALARPGVIRKIEVDTAHFKGNFPDRCSLQAARVTGGTDESLVTQAMFWPELLAEQKLQMDHVQTFADGIASLGPVTHVRFNIFPDGGVSRLRLWSDLA
ncbi:allantoicase [Paraburkholderia terricola]|uniref:Probable allantoicase n=1 Tax=Paraburkholderia terricola TaxID=169427 RepID=A0ABU1LRU1_9BURK|nr:allantoicase [Paraburkholderia terricola]MDR6409414.1 allantoicase [Paraburkholderia terricola]MDR6483847.1 allantoicase [Paraburkholderia terricola]